MRAKQCLCCNKNQLLGEEFGTSKMHLRPQPRRLCCCPLLIRCKIVVTIVVLCIWSMFYCSLPCILSSIAIILMWEERAGCLTLFVFLVSLNCYYSVVHPHGAPGCSAVCVVVFPNHNRLFVIGFSINSSLMFSNFVGSLFLYKICNLFSSLSSNQTCDLIHKR